MALVYIMEAHATDEWPILDTDTTFTQHTSIEERRAAAEFTCGQYPVLQSEAGFGDEVYLDPIDNAFNSAYASWPLRYWILKDGRLAFKAMPKNATYSMDELEAAIQRAVEGK